MLGHYVAVALRLSARRPFHTVLTVLVLVLGLTCFLGAALFARWLGSFDRGWALADRTYVLYQRTQDTRGSVTLPFDSTSAFPVAEQVRLDVPELAAVARYYELYSPIQVGNAAPAYGTVAYADPAWQQ